MTNSILDTQRSAGGNAILDTNEAGAPSGITAVAAWTEGSEQFAVEITVTPPAGVTASAAWTEGSETFAIVGTVQAAPVTAVTAWTEGAEVFALVGAVARPSAVTGAAAWTEGSEQFAMAIQVQSLYARAPAGSGYSPRTQSRTIRPADIQGYNR